MAGAGWALLVLTAALAVGDWFAVSTYRRLLEYVCKPATIVALVGLALALDPPAGAADARGWFVAALLLSLVGDVFLMLPQDVFVPGLASFLLAHLAYVVGLSRLRTTAGGWVVGVVVVALALVVIGRPVLRAVRRGPEREMTAPVAAYMLVISTMVATAVSTGEPLAIAGALLFYCSDALIAITRFVRDQPWGRLAIIATYHVAQVLLVVSLVG